MAKYDNLSSVQVDTMLAAEWVEMKKKIKPANWLTKHLVDAYILPVDFKNARIAPSVVANTHIQKRGEPPHLSISIMADPDYLDTPPTDQFFPHESIKNSLRKYIGRIHGKPGRGTTIDTSMYPGYVFPDMSGGSIYLDDELADPELSIESIRPAVRRASAAYDLSCIALGSIMLTGDRRSFVPLVPLPSVIREALRPSTRGINLNPNNFVKARKNIERMIVK